jgi:hypothetical protein
MAVFEILAVLERNKRNIDTPEVLEARPACGHTYSRHRDP